MIPKIIHQIWLGNLDRISDQDKKCIDTTKNIYKDFEYNFWTNEILEKNNYFDDPVLKNIFVNIKKIVKYVKHENNYYALLSDILRLKIINLFGGIYFDVDIEHIKQIDNNLLDEYDDIICGIPYPYGAGGINGIENAVLFGCKNSKLYDYNYKKVLKNIFRFYEYNIKKPFYLELFSGPKCFTDGYNEIKDNLNEKVYRLPSDSYYPYMCTDEDIEKYKNVIEFPGKNVYGIHRWRGNWRK